MIQSFADLGTSTNFIITPDTDDYLVAEHVRVCKLLDFLTKHLHSLTTFP
jgi:hypothetical protein